MKCKSCNLESKIGGLGYCEACIVTGVAGSELERKSLEHQVAEHVAALEQAHKTNQTMADKYPKYYKHILHDAKVLDVYAVCQMFPVDDPTGCINHARKKLLVPGTRTGGKSFYQDIKEARDTLNRYLELHAGDQYKTE